MKNLITPLIWAIFILSFCCIGKAYSQSPYIFGFGGYNFGDEFDAGLTNGTGSFHFETEGGFTLGAGIGVQTNFLGCSRFEFEGVFAQDTIDTALRIQNVPPPPVVVDEEPSSDVITKAYLFNFVKEIPMDCFTPYVGVGLGLAYHGIDSKLGAINFRDFETVFAWQAMIGVDYPLSECISLFTQYRLLSVDEANLSSMGVSFTTEQHYSHSLNVGARYYF